MRCMQHVGIGFRVDQGVYSVLRGFRRKGFAVQGLGFNSICLFCGVTGLITLQGY